MIAIVFLFPTLIGTLDCLGSFFWKELIKKILSVKLKYHSHLELSASSGEHSLSSGGNVWSD